MRRESVWRVFLWLKQLTKNGDVTHILEEILKTVYSFLGKRTMFVFFFNCNWSVIETYGLSLAVVRLWGGGYRLSERNVGREGGWETRSLTIPRKPFGPLARLSHRTALFELIYTLCVAHVCTAHAEFFVIRYSNYSDLCLFGRLRGRWWWRETFSSSTYEREYIAHVK